MTRQLLPSICDFCAKEIASEMAYNLQISQKGKKGESRGKFVKAQNTADMCHPCFLKVCVNGYKPNWIVLEKNSETGKWEDKGSPEDNE